MINNIKLYKGDCLEILPLLPENSVDLVVTSPPYDNLRSYNGQNPFTFEVFKEAATQLYRVLKQGGVIVWVVGDATIQGSETGTSFRQALFFKEIGLNLHDTMIYKAARPPKTHNRYEQEFEYMFILSKGKPKTVNHIKIPCTYADESRKSKTMRQDSDELTRRSTKGFVKQFKIKGNVWTYPVGFNKTTKDKIAFKHPAIFPDQLAHDHIISWSNEGDTVLDPFMGSGTTGVACQNTNRNFIGIEKEEKYMEIAIERMGLQKT